MFTNESLPLRSLGSSQAVKQRNRRYNGLGLATSQIPDLLVTSDETKPRKLPWYQINWTAYTQTGNPALVFWMSMTIAALVVFTEEATTAIVSFDGRILNGTSRSYNMKLLLQSHQSSYGRRRFELHPLPKKTSGKSDYGKLILHPRKNADEPIPIRSSSVDEFDQQRDKLLGAMDKSDDESYLPESSKEDEESKCRKVSWAAYSFPNCNQVHEHPITVFSGADFEVSYLK